MSIREHTLKYPNAGRCDNWVIIFMNGGDPHYRLLMGTSGGYTSGDSWQINSGVTAVEEDEYYFYFHGASGSVYACNKESYMLRMNNAHIWARLQHEQGDKVQMMDEETDWMNHDWIIS